MLEVTLYDHDGKVTRKFWEEEAVDYVSLVSAGTYGPPALIAPARNANDPRAEVEDRVLYINTAHVPAFLIERTHE